MYLRVTLGIEPLLAGGTGYASEQVTKASAHAFLTHGLGGLDHSVTVIPPSLLARNDAVGTPSYVDVTLRFDPEKAAAIAKAEQRHWTPHKADAVGEVHPVHLASDTRTVLPPSASLGINGYVGTYTDTGLVARSSTGTAYFLLADMAALPAHPLTAPSAGAAASVATASNLTHAMWENAGDTPLVKGVVRVVALSVVNAHGVDTKTALADHVRFDTRPHAISHSMFHPEDALSGASEHAVEALGVLNGDIVRSLDIFFGPADRVSASKAPLAVSNPSYLRRMHTPEYETEAGRIVGSAYAKRIPRALHADTFFVTTLAMELRRSGLSAKRVLDWVEGQPHDAREATHGMHVASRVFVGMLSTQANSFPYLDDFTRLSGKTLALSKGAGKLVPASQARDDETNGDGVKGVEKFKDSQICHCGDCEDVAKVIFSDGSQFCRAHAAMHFAAARAHDTFVASKPPDLDAVDDELRGLLSAFHRVFAQQKTYVSHMVLGGVSTKNLTKESRFMSDKDANAHTFTTFVPTARYLDALVDNEAGNAHRNSAFMKSYVRQPWHQTLHVRVAEGTARASSDLLPLSFYHRDAKTLAKAQARQAARLELWSRVGAAMPPRLVSSEILNRGMSDPGGDVANDRVNVSSFYNAISAAFVNFAPDTGYDDIAYARVARDGTLTHGNTFTAFALPKWAPDFRIVPYNRQSARSAALTADVLEKLESIPAARRDTAAARRASDLLPSPLRKYAARVTPTLTSATVPPPSLSSDSGELGIPRTVAFTAHQDDLNDELARGIAEAIERTRGAYSKVEIVSHYLSDPPLAGDVSGPNVQHDIEFTVLDSVL